MNVHTTTTTTTMQDGNNMKRQQEKKEIMMILATEALLQKTSDGDFLILIERIGNVSIYDNATWNEYVCKLDGNPGADYHTNCIEDARNTAQQMRTK